MGLVSKNGKGARGPSGLGLGLGGGPGFGSGGVGGRGTGRTEQISQLVSYF